MKFSKILAFAAISFLLMFSCKKDDSNHWNVEIESPVQDFKMVDISKDYYDTKIPLEVFKEKYPWFQGNVPDQYYEERRTDTTEVKIYKEAIAKQNLPELKKQFEGLFSHIHYYFPKFKSPTVYLYSSVLQTAKDPIFYKPEENLLFVDITGFMGDKSEFYQGMENYFKNSMNPENLVPKASQILAQTIVMQNPNQLKLIDKLIYQGKIQILQDAFLPDTADYLKINYTKEQYDWAVINEANIWNFFVENDLLFSDDSRLDERFLNIGPFSKFYTEIDRESSPQIGIFTGWQICKAFFKENPDTKLTEFLNMDAQLIFNESHYSPKN